jgi:hypothetical protein
VPYDLTGTTTLVAANGDKLFGTVTGTGTSNIVTGQASGTNLVTITGGGLHPDVNSVSCPSTTTCSAVGFKCANPETLIERRTRSGQWSEG